MSYVLLVDDEPEILEVLEMTAQMVTNEPIKTCQSGNQAWKLIETLGTPVVVVCDYRMPDGDGVSLYTRFRDKFPGTPFIVCSGNPLDELKVAFPTANGYAVKPQFLKPVKEMLSELLLKKDEAPEEYVTVPLAYLLKLGVVEVDAYLKLSDNKFVRVHQKGNIFDEEDFSRLQKKFLTHLYVTRNDANELLKRLEVFLRDRCSGKTHSASKTIVAKDALETTASFARSLGWSQDVVNVAKATVDLTVEALKNDKEWKKLFENKRFSEAYGDHISILSMLTCMVAYGMGWVSEMTQQKLIMATLIHDYYVEEAAYELPSEADRISRVKDYRMHPIKAAELTHKLSGLPSDVDKIILQHHELPDGSGFPRGLTASHLSPMSALFIICEKLVLSARGHTIDKTFMDQFWVNNQIFLEHEPFKKIALSMLSK